MSEQQRKPCSECPFRRGTTEDGGSPPEVYVGQSRGPFLLSCHMCPGYAANRRSPEHLQCAGAAIFRANTGVDQRMPRQFIRLPADRETVFATPAEMIAHHRGISIAEAEAILRVTPPDAMLVEQLLAAGVQPVDARKVTDGRKT